MMGILVYAGSSFLLHLAWENSQAPFYQGYESFAQHFWICFWGTITGDMIFMAVIYLTLALVHQNLSWICDRRTFMHPATWLLTPIIGMFLGVSFELWAVHVAERWVYANMPLIPILEVGVFPVLQMVVVPLLVLFIGRGTARCAPTDVR